MDSFERLRAIAADLERQRPDLKGVPVRQVPELAGFRYHYRRRFYRWANVHIFFAIFNVAIAASPLVWLWPLNALAAGLAVWTVVFMESRARAMTRQLNRPAIEQVARDLVGLRD